MSNDKISPFKKNKKDWFGNERRTKLESVQPNHRYFMSKIKEKVGVFLTENKERLLKENPRLLYQMQGKPVPKKYQIKVAAETSAAPAPIIFVHKQEEKKEPNELDRYQEDMKKKRQLELEKQRQPSLDSKIVFSSRPKKDPRRGMGWVIASGPINKGKLGHSQSWRNVKKKKYEYYG